MQWWRDARFGMFIHWGLYAATKGYWNGKETEGIGEWIMHREKIPLREYRQLATRFNPTRFDAAAWVALAKDAGMKYLVITAKHHDGFAMYDSAVSDYDIVDATPFARDPMKELAKACKKAGITFCFYYSQDQDWEDPNGSWNDWDYDEKKKNFAAYLRDKVKPQLRELLTQYGPIGLIWFDTPFSITRKQSIDLKRYVHRLQPGCLVSGRVGHGVGDYESMGDNQIPVGQVQGDWETPATLNDTWGYKSGDRNWKSTETLLHLLVDLAGKGVNYVLNVGPTDQGVIPSTSVKRLKEVGAWMRVHGEAIYGTEASPYSQTFDWGRITTKGRRLYLLVTGWRRKLNLPGLYTPVKKATMLNDRGTRIPFEQSYNPLADLHDLELALPARKPNKYCSVIVLHLEEPIRVDTTPTQFSDGRLPLYPGTAEVHAPRNNRRLSFDERGATANWTAKSNWLSWNIKVREPGRFDVQVIAGKLRYRAWKPGHAVTVSVGRAKTTGRLTNRNRSTSRRAQYDDEFTNRLGTIQIDRPGTHTVKLRADTINRAAPGGLIIVAVELVPKQ